MRIVGIDLGGTVIKAGLLDDGHMADTFRMPADSAEGLAPKLGPLADSVDAMLKRNGIDPSMLDGVAVAFPGIADIKRKKAAAVNAKYPDAPSLNLADWASLHWPNASFVIDNDARMALAGEWTSGAAKGRGNVVMMTIGTGIGTGVVVDGHLIYGRNFCAGSLGGHFVLDYKGRRCTCGNIGCVEALASSFFLPEIISSCEGVSSAFKEDPVNRNFKELFRKYREKDPDAEAVVKECLDVWSAAIVTYIHAYDPETVVMGGGVMKSADVILPYVTSKVNELAWSPGAPVEIVAAALGDDAALVGASYYFTKE